jgi:hypothetical protein
VAKVSVTKIAGLYTSPNTISSVPEGALRRADNCVINFPNTIESRRGFEAQTYSYGTTDDRATALFAYEGHVLLQYDDKLAYDSGAAIVNYSGTNSPPDPSLLRMKAAESAQNFYYTTADGVKVLDAYNGTPVGSGVPRAHLGAAPQEIRLAGEPGDGWFGVDGQVAYLAVLGRRDAKDNVVLGEASTSGYLANPANYTIRIGEATKPNASAFVTVTSPDWSNGSHGFIVGDKVSFTFDAADAAYFVTGAFALTEVGSNYIKYTDAVNNASGLSKANTVAGSLTSGSKNAVVTFNFGPEIDDSFFMQVYRTKASLSADDEPVQDYYLVKEVLLEDVLPATTYQFTDNVPEGLLLQPFYGNANVGYEIPDGSPDNENGRPPLTRDLEVWDNRLWGANYQERQNLIINLLGVGGTDGLQAGDTITVDGITFTAVTETATPGAAQFRVYDVAWHLPSEAVRRTAQELAVRISSYASSAINCYYTSGEDETPGELFLEAKEADEAVFSVYVSRASAWNPVIGTDVGSAVDSTADTATNGVWFSKIDQPEAVPRLNRLAVGPRNGRILRIKGLGERLFFFTDRGIYTVSGQFPYRTDLLSKTAVLVAPDSLVDFDDALFALTTQGVVRISDAGVAIMSVPVEADLKRLFGEGLATLKVKAQAVGYESYRKYILSMPTDAEDTDNTQSLVYDVSTQSWTRWDKPIACAVVVPETDYLYIGRTDTNVLSKERKTYSRWDYVDESFAVTVSSHSGRTVTLASATGVEVGDLIYQSALCHDIVESVVGNVVTVSGTQSWTNGMSTRCYKAIACDLQFQDNFAGDPHASKHFQYCTYHFKTPGISTGVAYFSNELAPAESLATMDLSGWGDTGWGDFAWLQPGGPKNKRVGCGNSRCSYMSVGFRVTEGLGTWALYGYTLDFEPTSERNSR